MEAPVSNCGLICDSVYTLIQFHGHIKEDFTIGQYRKVISKSFWVSLDAGSRLQLLVIYVVSMFHG